jgi:hypothetical protein
MDVILQVTNMESQTAFGVFATCVPPVETNGLRNIRLVSAASPNPMDIPAWTYPRYVWRYTFEIKNGRTATFSLGAVGTNTNQVNTTVSFTA